MQWIFMKKRDREEEERRRKERKGKEREETEETERKLSYVNQEFFCFWSSFFHVIKEERRNRVVKEREWEKMEEREWKKCKRERQDSTKEGTKWTNDEKKLYPPNLTFFVLIVLPFFLFSLLLSFSLFSCFFFALSPPTELFSIWIQSNVITHYEHFHYWCWLSSEQNLL